MLWLPFTRLALLLKLTNLLAFVKLSKPPKRTKLANILNALVLLKSQCNNIISMNLQTKSISFMYSCKSQFPVREEFNGWQCNPRDKINQFIWKSRHATRTCVALLLNTNLFETPKSQIPAVEYSSAHAITAIRQKKITTVTTLFR